MKKSKNYLNNHFLKSIIFLFVFQVANTNLKAQEMYAGMGANAYANDKIYFNTETINPSIGVFYLAKNQLISYELTCNFIQKDCYSVPVMVRFNSLNKLSVNMGAGFNFMRFKHNFDLGLGLSPGISFNSGKFRLSITGSYFRGLINQTHNENHPGGTVSVTEHNDLFLIHILVYYRIFQK